MAAISFEVWAGTPSWTDLVTNTLVFSGSRTNIAATVAAQAFQDGTHIGSGNPGTDICGATHANNVKILTSTTCNINGAGSVALNDTNLVDNQCTMRIHFNDPASFSIQNARFYIFDGAVTNNPAPSTDVAAYVKYAGMTQWATLNSGSTIGPNIASMTFQTANVGGDNGLGNVIYLPNLGPAIDQYWYTALSVSPETPGLAAGLSAGVYLEYF